MLARASEHVHMPHALTRSGHIRVCVCVSLVDESQQRSWVRVRRRECECMLHDVHLCTYLSLGQEACSVHKQGVVVCTPGIP